VNTHRSILFASLLLLVMVVALALPRAAAAAAPAAVAAPAAAPEAEGACPTFRPGPAGSLVSAAFSIDAERHAVISPPLCVGGGELLWIRPLRLNPDEYLILQKCASADCTKAEVVRAWNAYGHMGPYPVLNPKIWLESGARYMLWMQRVSMPGNQTFKEIDREGSPLVFSPFGSLLQLPWAREALEAAAARGPTLIQRSEQKGSAYVATFQGGSSVWMRAIRTRARTQGTQDRSRSS